MVIIYFAIIISTVLGQETVPPLNPPTYEPEVNSALGSPVTTIFMPGKLE